MVHSSKAACEAKQQLMKEKLEVESLRLLSESLKTELHQAKSAVGPLQTIITGLRTVVQDHEHKAQQQETETQRLEQLLQETNTKLIAESKVVESLQEKVKVLDACSTSLATLKDELQDKCSKVESLEAELTEALKKKLASVSPPTQEAKPVEVPTIATPPPAVEIQLPVVTASTPNAPVQDDPTMLAKIVDLQKEIVQLKDQFNTKENELYQKIKVLQSDLQDAKTKADHFKFDFEEVQEKLLTANVTIVEYRNSKSALLNQLNDVVTERNLTNKIVVEKDTVIFQLKMNFAILADLLKKHGIKKNPESEEPEKLSDGEIVDVIERYIEETQTKLAQPEPKSELQANPAATEETTDDGANEVTASEPALEVDERIRELQSQIEGLENQLKTNSEQNANDINLLKTQKKDLFEKLKNTETERDKLRIDSANFKTQLVERDHANIQQLMQIEDYQKNWNAMVGLFQGEHGTSLRKGKQPLKKPNWETCLQRQRTSLS